MTPEEMEQAIFNAMVKFHKWQMANLPQLMETVVDALPVDAIESKVNSLDSIEA